MKRKWTASEKGIAAKCYRGSVAWRLPGCEMCGAEYSEFFDVHHPLGKAKPYEYDIRNGIFLCRACHEKYDHNLGLLLIGMRTRGIVLAQADWLDRHQYDKDNRAHEKREGPTLGALRAMWTAIQAGTATRDDYRDWSE